MPARVLMIEDNLENLQLMEYLLRAWGHIPISAQTGNEGLELAHKEAPDLILCDILLPDLDGYKLAKALKSHPFLRQTPVIAVTALAMVGDKEKVLKEGFDGYIPKPINPEHFISQVEDFLGGSLRGCRIEHAAAAHEPWVPPASGSRSKTVLVVDNNPVNLTLARDTLEPAGFHVVTAADPDQALEIARRSAPDLILSDVHMPGYDVLAFLKAVKDNSELQAIPFVFISASYDGGTDREKAFSSGAAAFITRPIEPEVLLAQLERCLGGGKR